jgi:hypothetical protein
MSSLEVTKGSTAVKVELMRSSDFPAFDPHPLDLTVLTIAGSLDALFDGLHA